MTFFLWIINGLAGAIAGLATALISGDFGSAMVSGATSALVTSLAFGHLFRGNDRSPVLAFLLSMPCSGLLGGIVSAVYTEAGYLGGFLGCGIGFTAGLFLSVVPNVFFFKNNLPTEKSDDQKELLRQASFEKNARERASLKAELIQLQKKRETNLYGLLLLLLFAMCVAIYFSTSLVLLCLAVTVLLGIIMYYIDKRYKRIYEIQAKLRNKNKSSVFINVFLLFFAIIGLVWYLY